MRCTFARCHPIVVLLFFAAVIVFGAICFHPAALLTELAAAFSFCIRVKGRGVFHWLVYLVPTLLIFAVINVLFNHKGITVLFYLADNPVTLESMVYGVCSAVMLLVVLFWFVCLQEVLDSDKCIYLFSRVSPALALLLSMTLRFIPVLKKRASIIRLAQKGLVSGEKQTALQRMHDAAGVLGALMTWSLEGAIETADSMRARGYGLRNRSSFSIYHFSVQDAVLCVIIVGCVLLCATLLAAGAVDFRTFPSIAGATAGSGSIAFVICYACLCFLPLILELLELIKWKILK